MGTRHRRGSGGCSWQASRAFCNARQEGCSKAQARRATTGRQNKRVQHALAARNPCRDRERGMWRTSSPCGGALGALSRIVQVGAQESQKNVRTAGSADPFTRKHYSWRYRDYAGRVERVRWRHMRADGRWALATGRSSSNPGAGKGLKSQKVQSQRRSTLQPHTRAAQATHRPAQATHTGPGHSRCGPAHRRPGPLAPRPGSLRVAQADLGLVRLGHRQPRPLAKLARATTVPGHPDLAQAAGQPGPPPSGPGHRWPGPLRP